ncbi:hypothetical protein TNCV_447211 [Trichonephila clavipes]|nr:hypothetical protein TNCV_447211 [Trichonephila clavipes]
MCLPHRSRSEGRREAWGFRAVVLHLRNFRNFEALRLDFGFNIVGLRVEGKPANDDLNRSIFFEHEALKFNPSLFEPVAEAPVFELVSSPQSPSGNGPTSGIEMKGGNLARATSCLQSPFGDTKTVGCGL